ncbi:MAG TPA: SIMPL domain-containing protein [Verrucomicrobiae bacterium]|nr:SIMPL domain-containing protein [Verrucomicrobiae bacterium]
MAFGQAAAGANSVTVTATRSANVQPDQVVFTIEVNTPNDGTLDSAVAALQGSGVTAANFSSVATVQIYDPAGGSGQTTLAWYFSLTVSFSDMKSTIGLLSAVQQSAGARNNGISVSFSVSGTAVSPQAQQSAQCSQSGLLSDAKAQAQQLANAAGKALGSVLAMSSSTMTTTQSSGPISSTVSTPACSLTVKFQLTGF